MIATIAREWTRIGCIGFGGPPAHIALLRELCVERRGGMDAHEFEDAMAACQLLPGPASTQMAIFRARRLRGWRGALVGGAGRGRRGGGGGGPLRPGPAPFRDELRYVIAGAVAAALAGPYVVLVLLLRGALKAGRGGDRPAHAARRGRPRRVNDRRAVPQRRCPRAGDARAGHPHGR